LGLFSLLVVSCSSCGSPDKTADAPAAPAGNDDATPPATGPTTKPSDPAPPPAPTPPSAPTPPAALACMAGYYVGTPVSSGSSWSLKLPDGTLVPWDDGKTKTYDEALADPDLQDMLSIPYTTGPIAPDTTLNLDPGRIRNDVLSKATFGGSAADVMAKLVDVDFVGQTVKFHPRAATALGNVSTKLKALVAATPSLGAYVTGSLGGTFNWRVIAMTNRMSPHSYAIAIDVVVAKSNYWEWDTPMKWTNQIPQAIVDAFESEGFVWGGRWYHYDTMHFEYRPELFDPKCKP
ncbi:MAG TPA: M15 family metallopeptidase, partial [Labilithrix sp.]